MVGHQSVPCPRELFPSITILRVCSERKLAMVQEWDPSDESSSGSEDGDGDSDSSGSEAKSAKSETFELRGTLGQSALSLEHLC